MVDEPGGHEQSAGPHGAAVVDGEVSELDVTGDALSGARLADGRVVPLQALVVFAPVAVPASTWPP
jgi:hypothetical protein